MLKSNKSKFILFTILSIVVLLCFIPLISNLDYLFGMKGAKKNQHIDGDVDVSVSINVELNTGLSYFYYVEFDFTFNESVTDVEVEEIQYTFYHNGVSIYNYNGNYTPNIILSGNIELIYGDNLTYQGSIELNYQLISNPMNDTVNFNTIYTHNIKLQDAYAYPSVKSVIFLAYIASYFLLPIILFFTIHPDFYEPSKEEKERSEEYFNYIEKRKKD
jgi:hypothetical protein